MAMAMKEKLLFIWILAAVAFGFLFRHFWSCAAYLIEKIVALSLVSLPCVAKFAVAICGVWLLP
jgi:hypothetical protein